MHVMRTGYLEDALSAWQPLLQHTSRRRPSSSCSTVCTWSSQREAIAHGSARRVPLGIPIESHRGYYTLLEKMYQKLVCNLEEVFGVVVLSPRECSKVQEKLANYSSCMQRIKLFIQPFNAFSDGPHNNRKWDTAKPAIDGMQDVAKFTLKHTATLVSAWGCLFGLWQPARCTIVTYGGC